MDQLSNLLSDSERQRLTKLSSSRNHSILITARSYLKLDLAYDFLANLCQQNNWLFLSTKPDESGSIKIEATRQIIEKTHTTIQQPRWFVIKHAETLTLQAQNSLLKLLEEPNPGVFLILLSASPNKLLPTIKSRTQQLRLHNVSKSALTTILRNNFPKLDTNRINQILFIAQDDLQLLFELADSGELADRHIKIASDARQLITANSAQAVVILNNYFASREDAITLVRLLLKIHHSVIIRQSAIQQPLKITKWLTALKRLQANCSVRLTLLAAII